MTNIPTTWVSDLGSFDKIKQRIEPKFMSLGLKYFRLFDGNKLKALIPHAQQTELYFNPHKQVNQTKLKSCSGLNKISTINQTFEYALRQLNTNGVIKLNIPIIFHWHVIHKLFI